MDASIPTYYLNFYHSYIKVIIIVREAATLKSKLTIQHLGNHNYFYHTLFR